MEYIKVFETHAEYENYIDSSIALLPNLSYCEDAEDVHLNKVETRIVAKFNITNTTNPTFIFNNPALLNEVEIDGVVQPSVVTSYTFDTTGLHTVKFKLNDNVTTLDSGSFASKTNLIGIRIPNSITTIAGAFAGCSSLTNIKIPDSVTTIGDAAFASCSGLANITIPNSVTTIGNSAFASCAGLTNIIIGNGATSIGNSVFYNCTGLTSITIPNSITTIGGSAFSGCSGLTSVTISNSVTTIGDEIVHNCNNLLSITIKATTPPSIERDSFETGNQQTIIYVPAASVDTYKATTGWSNYASKIQAIPTT